LQELEHELRRYAGRIDVDGAELRRIEERLSAIHDMARKYRVQPTRCPNCRERPKRASRSCCRRSTPDALSKRERDAENEFRRLARDLTAKRNLAANELSVQVTRKLSTLAMAGGEFQVRMTALAEPASYGMEQTDFLVSTHAGQPLACCRASRREASCRGSASRCRSRWPTSGRVPVLIFDEVDVGIGGGVAENGRPLAAVDRQGAARCCA
jgi:DNA repair protein RecN (Recombination protein N)